MRRSVKISTHSFFAEAYRKSDENKEKKHCLEEVKMNFSIRPDFHTRVDYQTRQASLGKKPAEQIDNVSQVDKDRLSLSSGKKIDDKSFAAALSKATADSLRIGASEKRVAELHQQVQAGTYQPNAQRIAEKILGYKD
jgi:hypothetical protein